MLAAPVATVTSGALASAKAFASFKCNRWPHSPGGRVANSVRIAIVGDSMVYGQGVPYLQTLGPRLARHLNAATPGLWMDCQSFGVPGGCAWHALGRADAFTAAIEPDILVIALTQNDAAMLRPQPSTVESTADSWTSAAPRLRQAVSDFTRRWRAEGRTTRIAVLYFDFRSEFAGVRPQDILRPICDDTGVLFIDGVEPLAGTPVPDLWVSAFDSHLNAASHDRVARHVARRLIAASWIPEAPDFDDPLWIEALAESADSLPAAGVPAAAAASDALNTLQAKWLDRRNRWRTAHDTQYRSLESTLKARSRELWSGLALRSYQQELALPALASRITEIEDYIYRGHAVNYALRYAVDTGTLGQPIDGLLSQWTHAEPFTVRDLEAARHRAITRAGRADRAVEIIRSGAAADSLRPMASLAALAQQANHAAARGLADLEQTIQSGLPDSIDVRTVLNDALTIWRLADEGLAAADSETGWSSLDTVLAALAPVRSHMHVALNLIAAPGPEQWSYRVGAYSTVHSVAETYLACGYLVRDGRPTPYLLDLPLMVSSTITLTIMGQGLGAAPEAGLLKVLPARLDAPGFPPFDVRPSRAALLSDTAWVIEFTPTLIQRPA